MESSGKGHLACLRNLPRGFRGLGQVQAVAARKNFHRHHHSNRDRLARHPLASALKRPAIKMGRAPYAAHFLLYNFLVDFYLNLIH